MANDFRMISKGQKRMRPRDLSFFSLTSVSVTFRVSRMAPRDLQGAGTLRLAPFSLNVSVTFRVSHMAQCDLQGAGTLTPCNELINYKLLSFIVSFLLCF